MELQDKGIYGIKIEAEDSLIQGAARQWTELMDLRSTVSRKKPANCERIDESSSLSR